MIEHLRETDYDSFLHVYMGHARKFSEAVIFGGRYEVHEFPDDLWRQADRLFMGADYGFANDPSTLVRFFIFENTLYIEFEAGGTSIEFAGNMTDDGRGELEQMYDSVPGSRDWPIKGDASRPETMSFLRDKGFNVEGADKWEGCVEDGITHIKGFQKIVIHPRCKETAQEFALYSFKRDKVTGEILPVIVDKWNHYIDAIRYGLDQYIQRRGTLGLFARLGAGS